MSLLCFSKMCSCEVYRAGCFVPTTVYIYEHLYCLKIIHICIVDLRKVVE